MRCAVIGSTKIAEVHINELIKNNISEIYVISRHKNKRLCLIKKLNKKFKSVKFYEDKIDILKKKKFKIIDICSADEFHDIHLDYIADLNSIILIEKPIISLLKFNNNYVNFLNKIYKKNKKIVVCYPMLFLCNEFKLYLNNKKKFNKIKFNLSTGGRYNYKKIIINLMPHALTFLTNLIKIDRNTKIDFNNSIIKKNNSIFNLTIENIKIEILLSEILHKKTILSLTVNEKKITRLTRRINSKFINFIKIENKNFEINNPMSEFFKDFFLNINNNKYYYKNKNLTYLIMKLNFNLMFLKK